MSAYAKPFSKYACVVFAEASPAPAKPRKELRGDRVNIVATAAHSHQRQGGAVVCAVNGPGVHTGGIRNEVTRVLDGEVGNGEGLAVQGAPLEQVVADGEAEVDVGEPGDGEHLAAQLVTVLKEIGIPACFGGERVSVSDGIETGSKNAGRHTSGAHNSDENVKGKPLQKHTDARKNMAGRLPAYLNAHGA